MKPQRRALTNRWDRVAERLGNRRSWRSNTWSLAQAFELAHRKALESRDETLGR